VWWAEGCHITATSDDGGILNFEIDQKKENTANTVLQQGAT
jgi:hypothetical protein